MGLEKRGNVPQNQMASKGCRYLRDFGAGVVGECHGALVPGGPREGPDQQPALLHRGRGACRTWTTWEGGVRCVGLASTQTTSCICASAHVENAGIGVPQSRDCHRRPRPVRPQEEPQLERQALNSTVNMVGGIWGVCVLGQNFKITLHTANVPVTSSIHIRAFQKSNGTRFVVARPPPTRSCAHALAQTRGLSHMVHHTHLQFTEVGSVIVWSIVWSILRHQVCLHCTLLGRRVGCRHPAICPEHSAVQNRHCPGAAGGCQTWGAVRLCLNLQKLK